MDTLLHLRVQPKASCTEIVGWQGEVLRVRVTAPPEDGRANTAVVELVAEALDVAKRRVTVVRGYASRQKTVRIEGLDTAETRRRLDQVIKG